MNRLRSVSRGRHALREDASLRWWRHRRPKDLVAGDVATVRTALSGATTLRGPRWRLAKAGDAAAAIRLALLKKPSRSGARTDLVMSALLVCAADGNEAAAVVLAWARTRMRRRQVP